MIRTAVALSVSLILTACGSAGTAPSPKIVTYDVEQITSTDPSLPDLNQIRAKFGLQPLSVSATATRVAQKHAQDMATNNFFSHRGSDGSTGVSRLTAAGCRGTRAENIAKGPFNDKTVLQAWMDSPSHRASMLKPDVRVYGLANVNGYWVMTLAGRC